MVQTKSLIARVAWVRYDQGNRMLFVHITQEGTYQYGDPPAELAEELIASPDKDVMFHEQFRSLPHSKLSDCTIGDDNLRTCCDTPMAP
jgi:hypothetical protein